MYEAFTPYSQVYGKHPAEFVFDADGTMLPRPHADIRDGSVLECLSVLGVTYRNRPQLFSGCEDVQVVSYGERITVTHVIDGWVKDTIGWLPIELDGETLFELFGAGGGFGARAPWALSKDDSSPRSRQAAASWDSDDSMPMPNSPLIPAVGIW